MAAGDAVVKGTNDFTEQAERRRWVRGRGYRKIRSWLGPNDATKINALVASLQLINAEEIDVTEGHPALVQAAIPSEGDTIFADVVDVDAMTEWSLEPYDLEKALGTHGIFNKTSASAGTIAIIDAAIRGGTGADTNWESDYSGQGELNEYYKLKSQGVDTFLTFGYVLRSVLLCERDNTYIDRFQFQNENVGKVISWAQINVPAAAKIAMPKIRYYPYNGSAFAWLDIAEWLVRPYSIRYAREGRVRKRQLVQEYIGAHKWSATLYDGGTGTP
jgi:hypothetical protein